MSGTVDRAWWKEAVGYLPGVRERVDYLDDLGNYESAVGARLRPYEA